ncbi:MAG: amidohydrolase family protein, partial [Gemmatimonadaceae bacterium]
MRLLKRNYLQITLGVSACVAGAVVSRSAPLPARASGAIAFTHATVIDGRGSIPQADRTVVVRGTRIVAVGPADSVRVPDGAMVVDAQGKFLVPGLWDMHVHSVVPAGRQVLAFYIANGVTGVRDMASDWAQLTAWRREIARGSLIGPRIVASGPYLEGGDVPIAHLLVKTPADAQPAVDSLIRLGVDFIKVHSQLTRESYFAIAHAARSRRIPFVGHVPRSVGAADASDSGQRSIEHLLTIPNECTATDSVALEPRFTVQSALGRCTSTDLAPLFGKFVRNDTWVVPTLTAMLEVARWPKRDLPGDSLARY